MPRFQGCRAPSPSERVGAGTTSSGSMTFWKPRAGQRSQGPGGGGEEGGSGAEAVAALARAVGGVEGEDPRLQLGNRGTAVETGELLREEHRLLGVTNHLDFDQTGGETGGSLD